MIPDALNTFLTGFLALLESAISGI